MQNDKQAILRPREIKFAELIALGHDKSDAYRRAYYAKRLDPQVVANRANRLAAKPEIADRAAQFLDEIKLEGLDSQGKAYKRLLDAIDKCELAENWTAFASLMRQRLQCLGMLKENLTISAEAKLSDDQILDKLAGKDEHKRAMFKAILGQSDDYARS